MFQRLLRPAFILSAALAGCAAQPAAGSGPDACESRRSSASTEIAAAIDANSTCTQDSECQSIAFASKCFDSCTRAVSVSGAPAVRATIDRIDSGSCASYERDGCARIVPPCAPPTAPGCVAGRCQ